MVSIKEILTTYLSESGEKAILQTETKFVPKFVTKLLAGSPTTARKCPELDFGKSSDIYDSSMVPKSMVITDGQPLPLRDKTKTLYENELLSLQEHSNSVDNVDHNSKKVILTDRMASVNIVHKDKDMNTWMVNYISKKCSKVFEQSIYSSDYTKKRFRSVGKILE